MSLRVEEWPIDRLVPYARNPRKNDAVVAKMVSAIREFGFRIPIVAKSDGSIVDGHLRYKAALEMGLQTVPVALADELTDTQVKAFRLLANRSANWAEWDDDLLKLELEELRAEDFPIDMIGFEPEELNKDDEQFSEAPQSGLNYEKMLTIVVTCETEQQQEQLFQEFTERGLKCRVQSL